MAYHTHYIPYFTTKNGRDEQAVCGRWVRPMDHSAEPSCPQCQTWLEQDAIDHARTDDPFAVNPEFDRPVAPTFHANSERQDRGYHERIRR